MTHRKIQHLLALIIVCAACMLLCGIPAAATNSARAAKDMPEEKHAQQKTDPNRPNIVFIFADQLRYKSLGYAGDPKAMTPNIDKLSRQGVSFKNFVVNTPLCSAYRASLFTGKYASTTGMVVNELRINPNQQFLAEVLGEGGYLTGYIGKWHLWANQAGYHDATRNAFVPPGEYRLGFDDYWAAYNFNHENYEAFYFHDKPDRIKIEGYGPNAFTDLAIKRIRRWADEDQPFALFLSYSPPHDPWTHANVPDKWYNKFKEVDFSLPATWQNKPDPRMDRNTDPQRWLNFWKPNIPDFKRVYYAMVANLDWNIGRIMDAIKEAGIYEDTIVVFTSDHGEMFGAHGHVFKNTFYDEAVRVPMLIRWPGHIPSGHVSDACMSTVDIMPTLLGLVNLPIPPAVEGMDLSHLALGKPGPDPDAALLQGMGHTYLWRNGYEWRALRTERYTYAVYLSDGKEYLFDNIADPLQTTNLADNPVYQDTLRKLRERLRHRMALIGDEFKKLSWYREHWIKNRKIMRGAKGRFMDGE